MYKLALLLLTASVLLALPASAEESRIARARQLFEDGAALSQAEKWREAAEKYRASLALKRHPMTLYALGVAQRESDQPLAALKSFRAFLAEPSTDADNKTFRRAAGAAVDELVSEVGRVIVRAEPANASVRIDGSVCGEAPCFVTAGSHTITVSSPGHDDATKTLTVRAGSTVDVDMSLTPSGAPALPIALMSIGGGALIGGVVLTALGVNASMDTRDPSAGTVAEIAVGNALMAMGLAGVAAGWTWLALSPDSEEVALSPYIGVGSAGVQLSF